MPPSRKVTPKQLMLLLKFAESHPDIALGHRSCAGGPMGSQGIRQAWENISYRLNDVEEGITKSPEQWRRYWIELKAKTKIKAADSRRNTIANDGVPSKLVPLNDIEERIISLIGPKVEVEVEVEGLPEVRPLRQNRKDARVRSDHRNDRVMSDHRDARVPNWVYDIEMRRIAAEERHATAEERHATAMEAMVDLMTEIRDSLNNYLSNPPH